MRVMDWVVCFTLGFLTAMVSTAIWLDVRAMDRPVYVHVQPSDMTVTVKTISEDDPQPLPTPSPLHRMRRTFGDLGSVGEAGAPPAPEDAGDETEGVQE